MRAILTVKQKTFLTPHYIRVILEGAALETFAAARVGDNNKIIVPQEGIPLMLPDNPRSLTQEQAQRPIIRTYTMRNLDLEFKWFQKKMSTNMILTCSTLPN